MSVVEKKAVLEAEQAVDLTAFLTRVREQLKNLNKFCFICLKTLSKFFAKMRTCGGPMCEFSFKESNLGSLFSEIKRDARIVSFLIETAYFAFSSEKAADITEPFPSFLLNVREMRPEAGNLEYILAAQKAGQDVKQA